jgi:hypothetical protein
VQVRSHDGSNKEVSEAMPGRPPAPPATGVISLRTAEVVGFESRSAHQPKQVKAQVRGHFRSDLVVTADDRWRPFRATTCGTFVARQRMCARPRTLVSPAEPFRP